MRDTTPPDGIDAAMVAHHIRKGFAHLAGGIEWEGSAGEGDLSDATSASARVEVTVEANTRGINQGPRWMWTRYPYTRGINLVPVCQWMPDRQFGFRDVFDPAFLTELESRIRRIVSPQSGNP